jgi:hypothetical protein
MSLPRSASKRNTLNFYRVLSGNDDKAPHWNRTPPDGDGAMLLVSKWAWLAFRNNEITRRARERPR